MSTTDKSPLSDAPASTKVATLARLAAWLVRGVGWFAVGSLLAGLGAWWVLFGGWPTHGFAQLLAVGLGGLLLLPAAVLALFYQGLRDLMALPERIRNQIETDKDAAADTARAMMPEKKGRKKGSRLWRFVKGIWALRTAIMESKGLLIRYGAMIRFVNPWSMLAVLAATAATVVLGAFALVGGMLRLLLG
ncbi:MAG: hypothetical protein PPP56_07360 [Longimonas sp.]|uniref:hypothetical protein n=1 Tax=Longimonas sp. TaxID=2039626 RepID=UPI003352B481